MPPLKIVSDDLALSSGIQYEISFSKQLILILQIFWVSKIIAKQTNYYNYKICTINVSKNLLNEA